LSETVFPSLAMRALIFFSSVKTFWRRGLLSSACPLDGRVETSQRVTAAALTFCIASFLPVLDVSGVMFLVLYDESTA
jgi:hypothetical protein